jgi:hypothetical protein
MRVDLVVACLHLEVRPISYLCRSLGNPLVSCVTFDGNRWMCGCVEPASSGPQTCLLWQRATPQLLLTLECLDGRLSVPLLFLSCCKITYFPVTQRVCLQAYRCSLCVGYVWGCMCVCLRTHACIQWTAKYTKGRTEFPAMTPAFGCARNVLAAKDVQPFIFHCGQVQDLKPHGQ